jgi:hypothetical protein
MTLIRALQNRQDRGVTQTHTELMTLTRALQNRQDRGVTQTHTELMTLTRALQNRQDRGLTKTHTEKLTLVEGNLIILVYSHKTQYVGQTGQRINKNSH